MKNYLMLLLALLLASPAFSQKKGKEDAQGSKTDSITQVSDTASAKPASPATVTDTPTVKLTAPTAGASTNADSLNDVIHTLNAKLNTVSCDEEKYRGVYIAIKEKVLKHDFDPARISIIIDSLAAKRDSTFSMLAFTVSLKDSLNSFKKENAQLKTALGETRAEEAAKARLVLELKQLKELLDLKIITQTEFDTKKVLVLQKWK